MSSRLVETVMINVEDFAESFLTCGTCLSGYDAGEHTPKLLPCSHTVCRICLERILETQVRGEAFRCPICREGITVPRGGAASFPPAFIVNQLLDMLASQRRNLVPKCSLHPGQELLFCETCDKVFCAECTDGGHQEPGRLAHNVISFNVAIKRCSEILLYKAHLCIEQLNSAHESIQEELDRLDENTNSCVGAINESFEEVKNTVQRRHRELLHQVRKISDDKRRSLREQLSIIESERDIVRRECDQLNYQVDVRTISKGINHLNEKLDKVTGLSEPRENAYMRYLYKHNQALLEMATALSDLGRIDTSTTFPALCNARIPPSFTVNLQSQVTIRAIDYHGDLCLTGSDPVHSEIVDPVGRSAPLPVEDRGDGSYIIRLRPEIPGKHKLNVHILDRPIKESPFFFEVAAHQSPIWTCNKGFDSRPFIQPFAVSHKSWDPASPIYVLDTGNSRVVAVDVETGRALSQMGQEAMAGQAGTGAAVSRDGLWLVNWKLKQVCLLDLNTDQIVQRLDSSDLVEPTSVAVSHNTGEVYVADNGAGRVFSWDPRVGGPAKRVTGPGQVKRVTGLCVTPRDELILSGSGLQLLSREGRLIRDLWTGARSQFVDVWAGQDVLLATRTERVRSVVQVFEWSSLCLPSSPSPLQPPPGSAIVASYHTSTTTPTSPTSARGAVAMEPLPSTSRSQPPNTLSPDDRYPIDQGPTGLGCYEIDIDCRLKRPAGLVGLSNGELVVLDAGSHKAFKLKYK